MAHGRRRAVAGWREAVELALTWSEQTGRRYRVKGTHSPGVWLVERAPNRQFTEVCPVCKKRHTYRPATRTALA